MTRLVRAGAIALESPEVAKPSAGCTFGGLEIFRFGSFSEAGVGSSDSRFRTPVESFRSHWGFVTLDGRVNELIVLL